MKTRETITNERKKNTMFVPWEVIIEILLRLPVKSLVRFKSVCKLWLSLISDSEFAKSHFDLVVVGIERLAVLDLCARKIKFIDLNASLHDDSASIALKPEFLPPIYPFQILGSCRGFLLLDCFQSLWVWNPSTCVHKKLPSSPIVSNIDTNFFPFLHGFGYDPSTNEYLVVQVSFDPYDDHYPTHVECFSIKSNRWKEIEDVHLPFMDCPKDTGVGLFLNGAIHWFGFRSDISKNVIVAFDLTIMSFSEIPGPIDFDWDYNLCKLGVLGQYLGLSVVRLLSSRRVEIWIMGEYKVQSSWTKTIEVPIHDIPTQFFYLICSTKSGHIVGQDIRNGLTKLNYQGELHEYRYGCCDPYIYNDVVYTESLLSLPCNNEQIEEND